AYPSRSGVLTCTTRIGATFTRVTGTARLRSSQIWVMPTFSPTIALVAICGPAASLCREVRSEPLLLRANAVDRPARGSSAWTEPGGALSELCRGVPSNGSGSHGPIDVRTQAERPGLTTISQARPALFRAFSCLVPAG